MPKTMAQRMGRMLATVTPQSWRLTETSVYGSSLLGQASESQRSRRIRIQLLVTVVLMFANLAGLSAVVLFVTIVIPAPSVFDDAPLWVTWIVAPAYGVVALIVGTYWITRRTVRDLRWAIDERKPTPAEARNTLLAPLHVAIAHLVAWGVCAALLTTCYGLANRLFIPRFLFSVSICGILVATSSYLVTEFALRPVAADALQAGPPPHRFAPDILIRTIAVWLLGSGVPVAGIAVMAIFHVVLRRLTWAQFSVAVLVASTATLISGFLLTLLLSWLTATPVRVVRAALERVEQGDLQGNLVVFDGTELGELQRGFNSMVAGLRERERVRDLFGRHVGREVAAAAERQRPKLGGEERHVAVVFVAVVGSTQLATSRSAATVVQVLNRFFAIIVDEVDRNQGLVNKFKGDAALAIFGAPNRLDCPEEAALVAARAIAGRLESEMTEVQAGIGVAAGQVVAGNVGADERFEYTVIGAPVNEAARLCELAKSDPSRLLASSETIAGASDNERARWSLGETVTLRGCNEPTRLAAPVNPA